MFITRSSRTSGTSLQEVQEYAQQYHSISLDMESYFERYRRHIALTYSFKLIRCQIISDGFGQVLHITICICRALSFLHPTVTHRDIKVRA